MAGRGGRQAQMRYAAALDDLIRWIAARAAAVAPIGPWVVAAVGGYGRRTLCLHSDIDLLIVFDRPLTPADERFVTALLQPLWDLKLTVGQHVREMADCDAVVGRNPECGLALWVLRLLRGDVGLFDALCAVLLIDEARSSRLVSTLLPLDEARYGVLNDTVYQL